MNGPQIVVLLLFLLLTAILVGNVASSWGQRKKAIRAFQDSRDQAIRALQICEGIIDDKEYGKCMERELMK